MKLLYLDLETTDVKVVWGTGIHQIGLIIEVDGEVKEEHDIKVAPFEADTINPKSLEVAGVTEEDLEDYILPNLAQQQLVGVLSKYVDPFNPEDKFHFVRNEIACGFSLSSSPNFRKWSVHSSPIGSLTAAAALQATSRRFH